MSHIMASQVSIIRLWILSCSQNSNGGRNERIWDKYIHRHWLYEKRTLRHRSNNTGLAPKAAPKPHGVGSNQSFIIPLGWVLRFAVHWGLTGNYPIIVLLISRFLTFAWQKDTEWRAGCEYVCVCVEAAGALCDLL